MKRTIRKYAGIAIVSAGIALSFGFVQSYFELSKNLEIFTSIYREINTNYVEETNPGELMKTGIDAMLASLDPYTNYIPESQIESYRFMTTHEYGGIGAMIGNRDGKIIVTEPYENAPAAVAGILAGDIITHVDGKSVEGKSTDELSDILRGQNGTRIDVTIFRPTTQTSMNMSIVRENIKIEDVPYFGMLPDGVGYIALQGFTDKASPQVDQALRKLKEDGATKIILDLRGNGGGLLNEAVRIVNFFVPKGEKVVEVKGKLEENNSVHVASFPPMDTDIPLAVLIDGGSASASEIVSGSLQDLDRAVVLGQSSFGKGLVQVTHDIGYNSMLKLTIAKYYTPSGRCIQKVDYGQREAGRLASAIPDSLVQTFATRGGRMVKDAGGITPDIALDAPSYSDLLSSLAEHFLIFDFATNYHHSHTSIASASAFRLTDEEYEAFVDFALAEGFEYHTSSAEMVDKLLLVLKEDEFLSEVENEYNALKAKLERNKRDDLYKFRTEIQRALEQEILGRYYFERGRIEGYLAHDPEVKKAMEVLHNKALYDSVLSGTCSTCLIRKGG